MATNTLGSFPFLGNRTKLAPNLYVKTTRPTPNDAQNFDIGDIWVFFTPATPPNPPPVADAYILLSLAGGVANWVAFTGNVGNVSGLQTDDTLVETPNGAGNILISGDGVNITTHQGTIHQVVIALDPDITVTDIAATQLTLTGAAAGALVANNAGVVSTTNGTAGYVLTSAGAGMPPTFQPIAAEGAVTTIHTQDGANVVPTAGVINISGGNADITTTGNVGTSTVSVNLNPNPTITGLTVTGLTPAGVVTNTVGGVLGTTIGTANQILATNGAGNGVTWVNSPALGGIELIQTQAVSAVSSVVFAVPNTYNNFMFTYNNVALSNPGGPQLCMQISNDGGSTWISGATSYLVQQTSAISRQGNGFNTAGLLYNGMILDLINSVGGGAVVKLKGQGFLYDFTNGTFPSLENRGTQWAQAPVNTFNILRWDTFGIYPNNFTVNALRFILLPNAGTGLTGTFSLYGMSQ